MKIGPLKRKANTYESPIRPIFLALNSAEIYALTIGFKLLSENTVFQHTLGRVADYIYMNLKERIDLKVSMFKGLRNLL